MAALREKLYLLGSETQNKMSEIHSTAFFIVLLFKMVCKLLKGMKENGIYCEIFGVWFCSDRNFQLGYCQNKADSITGVGHLLDIS